MAPVVQAHQNDDDLDDSDDCRVRYSVIARTIFTYRGEERPDSSLRAIRARPVTRARPWLGSGPVAVQSLQ